MNIYFRLHSRVHRPIVSKSSGESLKTTSLTNPCILVELQNRTAEQSITISSDNKRPFTTQCFLPDCSAHSFHCLLTVYIMDSNDIREKQEKSMGIHLGYITIILVSEYNQITCREIISTLSEKMVAMYNGTILLLLSQGISLFIK